MEFLFADYTQKTEALVTGVRLQNEAFDIYELQLLGLDKKDSCSYTNSGTATISDTELQELLHTKGLYQPLHQIKHVLASKHWKLKVSSDESSS